MSTECPHSGIFEQLTVAYKNIYLIDLKEIFNISRQKKAPHEGL